MGFFDKLFGSDDEQDNEKVLGLREPDLSEFHKHRCTHVIKGVVQFKDSSREIKKEVWDGLTDPARNELKNRGFYCEGDNAVIHIDGIEPISKK